MDKTTQNASYTDAESMNSLGFSKNTKLIEKADIEGTPFKRVITEEGNFIALGVHVISKKLTNEEAEEKAKELAGQDWKLIMSIIQIVVQETVTKLHIDMMKFNEEMNRGEVAGE